MVPTSVAVRIGPSFPDVRCRGVISSHLLQQTYFPHFRRNI